jgi:hypothetical protein
MHDDLSHSAPGTIQLPRPTAWPLVLALGVSLIFAGMVTSIEVAILGLLLSIAGSVGWFFQVLPHEVHEGVPVDAAAVEVSSLRTLIERPAQSVDAVDMQPMTVPAESFSITTGIKGGIAGGAAMTIPALLFGLIKFHSIWYTVNLLAAGGFISWSGASNAFLCQFHLQGLLVALLIHGLTSLLVGLLYGAMLPMFPRYPIVTAGFIAPLLLTGILHSALSILSPILNQRIDWFWFILSQFAFGLVCGFVVDLQTKVRTAQFQALPFAVRAGLHSSQRDRHSDPSEREQSRAKPAKKEDSSQ